MNKGDKFNAVHFNEKIAEFEVVGFWNDGFGHKYIDVIRDDGCKILWLESDLINKKLS
jgi:hypothetical protein